MLLRLRVRNTGTTRWEASAAGGQVRLGVQLMGEDGSLLNRDYSRHELPAPMDPGEQCELTLRLAAPPEKGTYQFKLDLVREGMTWFELAGSQTLAHTIRVD